MKKVRFASVSAIAIVVSLVTLAVCYGLLGWDKNQSVYAQGVAFVTSTIASYVLNRRWVWGKTGKSNLWKEIVPFWGIGLAQLFMSVPFVQWGRVHMERAVTNHAARTLSFLALNLVVYGVMWVGKFMFFERVLFKDRSHAAA